VAWSSAGAPRASHLQFQINNGSQHRPGVWGLIGPAPWLGAVLKKVASRWRALRRASVPSSLRSIIEEKPTTSAARIAARRRVVILERVRS
jgi:hypothetical protein